jgi:hypothetical protein
MTEIKQRWARNGPTARYLDITRMTLNRWKKDPKLGFPAASVINGIEYNNVAAIDAFMAQRSGLDCEMRNEKVAPATQARIAKRALINLAVEQSIVHGDQDFRKRSKAEQSAILVRMRKIAEQRSRKAEEKRRVDKRAEAAAP